MLNYNWNSQTTPSVYVYIGGKSFTDSAVESFEINESIIGDSKISVGNTCNSTITLNLLNILDDGTDNTDVLNQYLINESLAVYIKSGAGASSSDIPMGSYVVTSVTVNGIITTIQGEGRFNHGRLSWDYNPNLDWGYEHYVSDLVDDVDTVDNIDTSMLLPDYVLPEDSYNLTMKGKTRKEMLGYIAAMYGMNVYLDRTGKPQFKDIPAAIDHPAITLTSNDLFTFNTNYNGTQIIDVYVTYAELEYDQEEQETKVVKGTSHYVNENPDPTKNNIQISIDIPFCSNHTIRPLIDKMYNYEYTAFQAEIVGNPNYEVGDKIQITDNKNNTYTGFIFNITHSYNGGFKQTISCNTDNTTIQNTKKTGTISGGASEEKVKEDVSTDITTGGTDLNEAVKETATQAATTSTVAEAINAFNLDSVFESLITNIKPCLLKYSAADAWVYVNTPPSNYIRNYIKIFENKIQFIESHFIESNTYADANTELFKLGNQQVYYTSITGSDAYKYLTFTNPTKLHGNDIQVIEYQARIPKSTNDYIKSEFKWSWNSTYNTFEPELVFGVGNGTGNQGKYRFYKDGDSGRFVYTSRIDGEEYGFKLTDTGVYDIFAGTDVKHRIEPVYDTLNDVPANFPDDQFFFIKTI